MKQYLLTFVFLGIILASTGQTRQNPASEETLPADLRSYIQTIQYGSIGKIKPAVHYTQQTKNLYRVSVQWEVKDSIKQDDLQVNLVPAFKPSFNWANHLTPTNDHIIAQHVFRSPALIVSSANQQVILIPDLNLLKNKQSVDWYMDMNAAENKLTIGCSKSRVKEHVLYVREKGAVYPPGMIELGFYLMTADDPESIFDPWRKVLSFFWKNWGNPLYQTGEPLLNKDLGSYVGQTYNWAFNSWKKNVWQGFTLNGKEVGAPVFIVNVSQSPNFPGKPDEREFRSIWNQAWFCSLRSAQGLYRYARKNNDTSLLRYSLLTKELALSFPQKNGFFYSVIGTDMEKVEEGGKTYNRSKGWDTHYFGNSNRNPYTRNPKESPFHVLDMSVTANLMLTWYDELEKDQRLLDYAVRYGDALIGIQREDGFFPGWLSLETLQPMDHLNQSPESAMSVTFLLKLYGLTKDEKYLKSAQRAMDALMDKIIPAGQWEDFETYWSCSGYGSTDLVGKKVARNNMFKQNNLSMYWTAEALFNGYKITHEPKYLKYGRRALDEMLMSQASWQPPYIYVHALGGFGVMNGDGEWNDSRQSLFAELIVKYGEECKEQEYIQRGLSALRASFVMMYSPQNPTTKVQWENKWPFFAKEDYGFMMENYGHGGVTSPKGVGIGEFTIYDWGNGAASEAYSRMLDHYGEAFINDKIGKVSETPPVKVHVDFAKEKGTMKPIWAWFGYDEPNYTYMKDGRKLLSELAALSPVPVYVRTHSLLVTGDGTPGLKWGSTNAYTEDVQGNPIYNWRLIDSIFDTYIQRGMKPLAQIGFMPEALSTGPAPYRHDWKPGEPYSRIFTGWAYPPKDYNKWRELIYQWVKHAVGRYGQKEVESWYWEVWNEPNGYWKGTREEYFKLYDYAADGLKRALPTARIGGLDIAGTSGEGAIQWMNTFIRHCLYETNYATGKKGSPLEALLFHAKGNPIVKDGVIWMNMSPQLRDIAMGIKIARSYPETKDLPLIVGESDPEGCAACGMATNPSNAYRNGTMYSSYTAASFARKYQLADEAGANLAGAVSWSFEFEDQPWFYGFRDLATNGVDKPVLNVFRMFGKMSGQRVQVECDRMYPLKAIMDSGVREQTDIGALASTNKNTASIMVWNYHDEDKQTPGDSIEIELANLSAMAKNIRVTEYRIDKEHSNSYEEWKKMGSPQKPTLEQILLLEKAGQLQVMETGKKSAIMDGKVFLHLTLPRQAVSLFTLYW